MRRENKQNITNVQPMRRFKQKVSLQTLGSKADIDVFEYIYENWKKHHFKTNFDGCFPRYKIKEKCRPLGYLFSDDEYHSALMKKHSWSELVERGLVTSGHREMLQDIQNIHDQAINEKDIELARIEILKGLLSVSKKYCLGFTQDIVNEINKYTARLESRDEAQN